MNLVTDIPVEDDVRGSSRSWFLTALGISVAVCMLALGSAAVIGSRNDAWKQARRGANNLVLALDRDIGRDVAMLDQSLGGLTDALAEPGLDQANQGVRHRALFDRSSTVEDFGALLITDGTGKVVGDSTSIVPHKLDLRDRDYFTAHQRDPDAGLYVSRPFKSSLGGGEFRFAISRRIPNPKHAFVGVVVATLRLSYFLRVFERLQVGQKGSITLLRTDGRILTRYPFRPADVDVDLTALGTNFTRMMATRSGQYTARSPIDRVDRLYTFRHIGGLPLIVTVNLSTEEIYAAWRLKAMVIGPVLLLLCAAAVTSSLLFRREMIRRAGTERALAAAVRQQSALAATDGLTGLVNRRAFDLEFERAFRRAVRHGRPVSLLMLDADFFKRFNDTYGHPAGDDVLRAIATCMDTHLRRPDDMKARYGGEEFVAILPNTSLDAARTIGERIRVAIEELRIEHTGSPVGHATVSVGIATMTPMVGFVSGELLQAADQALYAAKQDGRNCVRAIPALGGHAADLSFERLVALGKGAAPIGGLHLGPASQTGG